MRLARIRPKPVNPLLSRHVLSPQRRRDAETSAEKNEANQTLRVQSFRVSRSTEQGRIPVSSSCLVFSALISASLRLCGESTFSEVR
jgi:hypothetical protein